mgnify:CR=1 FL=1
MFNGYKKDIAAAAPKLEELQEGFPTEGSPALGIPATQPGAAWFHMITTELINAVKELGVTPDKSTLNQLATAILSLKFPTGTAFEYLRDKNYSKNDIVLTNERLYLCMANNGPASSVVEPGTNDSVWQKISLKQDVLALIPDATTSVKGIVQLSDDITKDASSVTKAVTPHAVAQQNYVKTVNGVKPDDNGAVSITSTLSDKFVLITTNNNDKWAGFSSGQANSYGMYLRAGRYQAGLYFSCAKRPLTSNPVELITLGISYDAGTFTPSFHGNASSATKATQDSDGKQISTTYVKLATAQTVSVQHNFSTGVKINGYAVTVG